MNNDLTINIINMTYIYYLRGWNIILKILHNFCGYIYFLNTYKYNSALLWILISSTSKEFCCRIKDLGTKPRINKKKKKKLISVLA